jgi:hypothetical protein
MTIKIEIEVPTDLVLKGIGSEYLDMAAGALGFARGVSSVSQTAISTAQGEPMTSDEMARRDLLLADAQARAEGKNLDGSDRRETVEEPKAEAPKRERGKPSPGKARRTKEEIAEDEAADLADQAKQQAAEEADLKDDVKLAVSTGEERINPDDAQDAADEAAETEKTGLASIDVLRRLVGDYQKKHGMPAAVKLCQEGGLIGKPIHELDDAGIEAAIAAMQGGAAPAVEQKAEEPAALEPKTKADLVEAMMRYADKYDGTRDQAKMVHTLADMPKVFVETFGEGVDKLSKVPEDKYAEAVAAVEAAIEADPYGRAK